MHTNSVAAPTRAVQDHFSNSKNADGNRAYALSSLPWQWQRGLLAIGRHKQPINPRTGRALEDWPTAPVPPAALLLNAPAVGLRTGPLTATLCLDFDGEQAWAAFEETFGAAAALLLPATVGWTSGKPHRCQLAFGIEPQHQLLLKGKRRKVGALELRWSGAQSVLMGHHPETGSYQWLEGCAPWEVSMAPFPLELLDLIPSNEPIRRQFNAEPAQVSGLVVPLEQFISMKSRILIANGSGEGQCNSDALALSLDLVGAEAWVKAQGVGTDTTAAELFYGYCRQCPEMVNGKPFDWRAMQARFDGALRRNPCPQTPEAKLFERLAYHRRMANRAVQQEAA